jgi:methyl-accepting chemotaxis protein
MTGLAPETPTPRARSSLRTKTALRVALLTATVIFAMGWLFFVEVKGTLEEQLAKRGQAMAKSIGRSSELALYSGRGQDAAEAIDPFFRGDEDIVYVLLLDRDERLLLSRIRRGYKDLAPAELVRIHRAIGPGPLDVHKHLRAAQSGILGFSEIVRVRRGAAVEPLYEEEEAAPRALGSDGGVAPDGGPPRKDGGVPQVGAPASEEVGRVLLGLSQRPLSDRLWSLTKVALGVGLGAVVVLVLGLLAASRRVFQRIARMVAQADQISRGDLTHRVEVDTDDELGQLGEALNRITTDLGRMLQRVQEVTGHLTRAVETLSATTIEVVAGAQVQSEAVTRTHSAVEAMTGNLRAIAHDVEVLSEAARQSSGAIQEMTSLNQEVLRQVVSMTQSVDETTSSIEQMAESIREVAQSVEAQSTDAARTSRSMAEMDQAIRKVQATANESSSLSELVRGNAEQGAEAVGRVLRGIQRIEKQGQEVLRAMAGLDQKVRSVGMILNLIDEIAEQVNLLSLNAAIIAAQAGEHGKTFAVVADEIKELADRTTASTREISELVKSIQIESQNAARAVEQAARNIEGGVRLTSQAEEALGKIVESAAKGAAMAKTIARATQDQAHGSEIVTEAARHIADAVGHVAGAASQQARASDLITRSALRMREITQNVDSSCHAEARAAEEVSRALERISRMVESLGGAQRSQARSADEVRGAIENIRRVAEGQKEAMATLQRAIETLSAQARTLQTEVERFTLS